MLAPVMSRAQESYIYRPVSIAVFPGFSTNGFEAGKVKSNFSLNIIGGLLGSLEGMEIGSVFNIEQGPVDGVQWAGVFNLARGAFGGFRAAGVFNMAGESFAGFEGAGVFNMVHGPATGAQMAGVFNLAKGPSAGYQAAGVWNMVEGDFAGIQQAGIFNLAANDLTIGQMAGVVNVVAGTARGAQLAGVVNVAHVVQGAQLSGSVNVADEITGAQLGLVNVAGKLSGLQLGLVNVCDSMDGVPIGLVSIVGNGQLHMNVWADEAALLNLGMKVGSKQIYNVFGLGYQPLGDTKRFMTTLGIGGHIPIDPFFCDLDLTATDVHPRFDWWWHATAAGTNLLTRLRIAGGWQVAPGFAITAGPALSVFVSTVENGANVPMYDAPVFAYDGGSDRTKVRIWPGFTAGLQLF
jgi:hypothetical protein